MSSFAACSSDQGKNPSHPFAGNLGHLKAVGVMLLLAALYVGAAKFGFLMAYTARQVTVIWPPTGIALAAVLLFGFRIWPGIALGAFLANVTSHEPVLTACGIALGNTLESVAAAWMLRRLARFDNVLGRVRDVRNFLVFAVLLGTAISATIGVTSLCLGGVQPWAIGRHLWGLWWVGDATGALAIAPMLLAWGTRPRCSLRVRDMVEATVLVAGLCILCAGIFTGKPILGVNGHTFTYPVFFFVIWAAIRFGQRGTTVVTLITSGIAIWSTVHDRGPFASASVEQSLTVLQIFVAMVAVMGLFLSAAITESRQAKRALEEADRRKDEFLSMLGHELRNPLAAISGALAMFRAATGDENQQSRAFFVMENQLRQIVRLVDDLVDVARISHGKIELRKAHIALAGVVNLALETVRPIMTERGHELSVDLGDEPLWLNADLTRLSQILINLLVNAAKYTPDGGRIRLEARTEESRAFISIHDSGIGIPPALLPQIFDMFKQAENPEKQTQGGLGIGLTVAKALIEMHGGYIKAFSDGPGKGSKFVIGLPLASPAPVLEPAPVSDRRKALAISRKFRILLADDNESFAETFGYMLELAGHEVRRAHDGPEALAIAQSFLPEIVLLDLGLPGVNGYDVCQKMRTMPILKNSLIIAQTGYSQPEHRERSKTAGFDFHLVKPIGIDLVEELLCSFAASSASAPDKAA